MKTLALGIAVACMLMVGGCGSGGSSVGTTSSGGSSSSSGSSTSYEAESSETQVAPVGNFSIEGKWKNVGTDTWGQMQEGAIIVFDGVNCNVFSPMDTYAFYDDGSGYVLDCTSPLGDTVDLDVDVVNENEIILSVGNSTIELARVS